ncbi:hypothetical protein [Burkholderia mayonis]|uniref:hypothetical protein n=1 Tax=Burkholderia mayonis TaxID=1385591 RepID=UPI000ADC6076|nr:hypothetical protein [Burkholderia mayonis]
MNTYAERLAWAMKCRGLSPQTDQSLLAKRVGAPCKPQNIQHLLDPNKNAKSSKYTPRIADILRCDVLWLAEGTGKRPDPDPDIDGIYGNSPAAQKDDGEALEKMGEKIGVNDNQRNGSGSANVNLHQLEDFFEEMKSAWNNGSVTEIRLSLMKGLLQEWNSGIMGSLKDQRLATRGGNVKKATKRGKTGAK